MTTAFFGACNRGDYKTANSLASTDLKRQMKQGLGAAAGGISGFCDYYTRNGNVKKMQVLDKQVQESRASVDLGILFDGPPDNYGEGDHARTIWHLVKQDDGWKLAPSDF